MVSTSQAQGFWTPRKTTALMMALNGLFFFFAFTIQDLRASETLSARSLPQALVIRYILAMAVGGAVAGLLTAGMFGRGGFGGWFLALLAGIVASVFAGMFGSAFGTVPELLKDGWHGRDFVPILFGALILPLAAAVRPTLLIVWLVLVLLTHAWARKARRARLSPA